MSLADDAKLALAKQPLNALDDMIKLQKSLLKSMIGLFVSGPTISQKADELLADPTIDLAKVHAITKQNHAVTQSLVSSYHKLSLFHKGSAVNKIKKFIFESHQVGNPYYGKWGFYTFLAEFYPQHTAQTLEQTISQVFSNPEHREKLWVRKFNEAQYDFKQGHLTLDFIKGICQALYVAENKTAGSLRFEHQVHVIFSDNLGVNHYLFGKEDNNPPNPLPNNNDNSLYANPKLFQVACSERCVWQVQPRGGFSLNPPAF